MHWGYRARRRFLDGKPWFDVVEYYVDGKDKNWNRDAMTPGGETKATLIKILEMMLKGCKAKQSFTDKTKS